MDPTLHAHALDPCTNSPSHAARAASRHRLLARLCRIAPLTALLCVAVKADGTVAASSQVPALGAHTLLVQSEGMGTDPAVSAPIDTQARGSSLLVLVGSYASNATVPTDTYGNHWKPLGDSVVYRGYEGRFSARAFVATDAAGGSRHQVRIAKPGDAAGEISAPFIEIRHAGVLQAVAQNYPAPGFFTRLEDRVWRRATGAAPDTSATLTSGTVATTGPATLVAVWWGDGRTLKMTATPDHGFRVIDQFLDLPPNSGVQCAVAVRQVDGPGNWNVSWTGAPAQGAILWLFAFQARR